MAWFKQDKAKLDSLTADQLSYSHSDAHLEDKTQFINGVMTRKATFKSLEWPELTVQVVGNINGMKFDEYGEYAIDLAVNGRHEARIPVYVRQPAE